MNHATEANRATSRYLATYLADHHAGGAGASALLESMIEFNEGNELATALRELQTELEYDLRHAERIAAALEVTPSPLKDALAKTANALGKLKLNAHVVSYSPLSRLLELEGLRAGVAAKQCMWRALGQLTSVDPRLAPFELERFEQRAVEQLGRVDHWHGWAARQLAD